MQHCHVTNHHRTLTAIDDVTNSGGWQDWGKLHLAALSDSATLDKVAQLAQRIGTSREMVSKLLRDLEKGGYMRSDGRVMWLLKKLPERW